MPQYIIQGKAHVALQKAGLDKQHAKILASGEKRNKGRGYRVFVDMTAKQAKVMGDALASLLAAARNDLAPAEVVAYNTAIERLGRSQESKPEIARRTKTDEFHTFGHKLPNIDHLRPFIGAEEARQIDHIESVFRNEITVLLPRSPFFGKRIPGQRDESDYKLMKDRFVAIIRPIQMKVTEKVAT